MFSIIFTILMHIVFILTLIAIFIVLKDKIKRRHSFALSDFANLENNLRDLLLEEQHIAEEGVSREEKVIKIMNLYEITKEICEFLEEDKIFLSFKNGLSKFITFQECDYLVSIDSQKDLSAFEVIPLVSESESCGYLAIRGFNEKDRPVLDILVAQFITGIKRARLYQRVQELAITDSLTKVFTRKYSLDRFEEELKRSKELNLSLSYLMMDVDNFKYFNDKYGHLVGDVIVKTIAEIIKLNCREIDLIGRFGGEEFIAILPMTSKDGALFAAERIRKSIESTPIKAFDESLKVTVSIGVSSFPQDAKTSQELIEKADRALYHSKRTGKNKVSAYTSRT
ncbi:MAG: GGDEF domain-containing protein [Candidatus Omnitrophica bacterium]|nr:GGDEF domain-containing protein [Candidatus Omnitrophota bacterium]MDD5352181.1 GGDEF domain-containing protein [Candidatus Omnitrophota bacterium]MDD5549779.1 GGDEF domain-containing protein [Candidatus Omnitrophota bacterium]